MTADRFLRTAARLWLPRASFAAGPFRWQMGETCCGDPVGCATYGAPACYNGTPLPDCVATLTGVAADSCGSGCAALNGEYTVSSDPLPASQYYWYSPLSLPCPDPLATTESATLCVSITCDFVTTTCVLRAAITIYRSYASGHPDDPSVLGVREIHTFEKWPTAILEPGSVHTIPYRSWQGWCAIPHWVHCDLVPRQCDASSATVKIDFSAP